MPWVEVVVDVPRGLADHAQALLFALGAAGTEEAYRPGEAPPPRQPWDRGARAPEPARRWIKGWLEDPDPREVEAELRARLGADVGPVTFAPFVEVDWEAQTRASFPPVEVDPRLVVVAPWDADRYDPAIRVVIEPGQGFGTGRHETTRQALAALCAWGRPGARALDVGCGSGVLALAAARLGLVAEGLDDDPVAVRDAVQNAARNDLAVQFVEGRADDVTGTWDVVLANLFAEVLVEARPALVRATGDKLILAGILADREPAVRDAYDPHLSLVERRADGEWVALVYGRP